MSPSSILWVKAMRFPVSACGVAVCVFALSACSSVKQNYNQFKNKPSAYMTSQSVAPLRIPPGIEHEPLLEDDCVPPGELPKGSVALLPPESLAQKIAEGKISKKELKHVSSLNLEQRDNQWFMILTDDKDHAWSRLKKALKNRKIRILQENKADDVIYIVDTFPTKGKITLASPIYQIHMRETAEQNTEVYLLDNAGHIPNPHAAHRILVEINRGLSGDKLHDLPKMLQKLLPSGK